MVYLWGASLLMGEIACHCRANFVSLSVLRLRDDDSIDFKFGGNKSHSAPRPSLSHDRTRGPCMQAWHLQGNTLHIDLTLLLEYNLEEHG